MRHTFLYCKKLFLTFYCLIATVAAVVSWAYWPSVRSRWPDIGQVLFCVFIDRLEVEVNENAKKFDANIQPSWAWSINDLFYGQKENFFLRDQRRKSRASKMGPSSKRLLGWPIRRQDWLYLTCSRIQPWYINVGYYKEGFKLFFSVCTLNTNSLKSCWCYHETHWGHLYEEK